MPPEEESARRQIVGMVESMLNAPIVFYGKVVDQNGDPVPKAEVRYSLLDSFNASGSGGSTTSDSSGWIEIKGVKGAILGVNVSKPGYYQIHNVSNQRFAYGYGTDAYTKPAPTKENPAVLVLHKMGVTEPLVVVSNHPYSIAKDGTPITIDLFNGIESIGGQVKFQAWTSARTPGGPRFYDWKCRISVPGGGIVERSGDFNFTAPENGYTESVEINMPKDIENWTADVTKSYFLKLPSGHFARIHFRMLAGGDHFFDLESHLNPKPGSRNLEFDPKLQP